MPTMTLRRLTAGDVMSAPVVTVAADESPIVAWRRMLAWGVHHLVVRREDRCIGVVDDRALFASWPLSPLGRRTATVGDLCRGATSCVEVEADLQLVARVMTVERVDAVPVVDADGRLIGLVTASDVASAVARYGVPVEDEAPCGS